jgi:hypothetical protein
MLRLCAEGGAEILSRVHDPSDPERTDTLYSLGEELSFRVSWRDAAVA